MNESVRRVGLIVLKVLGLVCAVAWVVLAGCLAGSHLWAAWNAPVSGWAMGRIVEAMIYFVLAVPGIIAFQRQWRLLKKPSPENNEGKSKSEHHSEYVN